MDFFIGSLYVCVDDMPRAISFYEDFFERKVAEKDDVYSVFDVNGFRFGLFAFKTKNEPHSYGTNCLPSITFDTLEKLKSKSENKKIVFPLTKIGGNWVEEIEDSEGNRLELTAEIKE